MKLTLPTSLGFVNYYILQIFFIRITRHTSVIEGHGVIQWYSIQYWILPFTGWDSPFIYISKGPKYLQLTAKKKKQ